MLKHERFICCTTSDLGSYKISQAGFFNSKRFTEHVAIGDNPTVNGSCGIRKKNPLINSRTNI